MEKIEEARKADEEIKRAEDAAAEKQKENELFIRLQEEYKKENFRNVEELLSEYGEKFERGEHEERVQLMKGNLFFDLKQYEQAISEFTLFIKDFPASLLKNQALLRLGISYFFTDEWESSINTFETLLTSVTLPPEFVYTANRYYARALTNKARFTDAVSAYSEAYVVVVDQEKRSAIEIELKDLIENLINWEEDLETTAEILHNLPGEADALYKLARIKSDKKDYTAAFFILKKLLNNFPLYSKRAEAGIFLAEINKRRGKHIIKIGCLAPLKGKSSFIGRKILNGLQLAFAEVERDEGIKLVVKDSSGGEERLLRATKSFSEDENILAVIGPAFSEEIQSLLEIAETSGLVLFTPTAASPLLEGVSPYLLRNGLTSKSEAFFMARVAIDSLGLSNLAVLFQDGPGGVELKNFFKEKINDLGGDVIQEVSFQEKQSDFGKQIRAIGGMSDGRITKILKEGGPLEDFGYDGIYIAGNAETVSLILPQLAYYNINNIPILGTSSLNSSKIIKSGNLYSKKLIFPVGFYASSNKKNIKNFTAKYQAYFNEKPGAVSAQAYDTAKILIQLIRNGFLTRQTLRNAITSLQNYQGI
ncbi:MAG: ABC transporter substrate-binding protein, partial [Nitrospinota bacterium]